MITEVDVLRIVDAAVRRSLDEAGIETETFRGMCLEVAIEKAEDMLRQRETTDWVTYSSPRTDYEEGWLDSIGTWRKMTGAGTVRVGFARTLEHELMKAKRVVMAARQLKDGADTSVVLDALEQWERGK